jgi:large subunit ribosomal protein L20
MTRVKRGNVAKKRRKKILKSAKGFRGTHSKLFRTSKQQVLKALKYSYIGRKNKKRLFRKLWICRINAASRMNNLNYSQFINLLKKSSISLNRKMLSQIAILDPICFQDIIARILKVEKLNNK